MNNNGKYCFLTLLLLLFLSLTAVACQKNNTNPSNAKMIDQDLLSQEPMQMALQKTYFSNQAYKQFSTVGLGNPIPNSYQMFWILKLLSRSKNAHIDQEPIISYLKYLDNSSENMPEIVKINQITGIYNMLNYDNYDKQLFITKLKKNYDTKSKLFYQSDQNEDLNQKLNATMTVIEALRHMDTKIPEETSIKNKLTSLYNQDNLFTKENMLESIQSNGGSVIRALYRQGYRYSDLKDVLKSRREWLDYWNSHINNSINNSDINSLFVLQSLTEINDFFGYKLVIAKSDLNNLFTFRKSFELTGGADLFQYIDPQVVYCFFDISSKLGYVYPFEKELEDYIVDSISSGFSKVGFIQPNIEDNYYGIALANRFLFEYDKYLMKEQMKFNFAKLIIENSKIDSFDKLRNVHFLVLSYRELNLDIKEQNLIVKRINEYLNTISIDKNEDLYDILNNFYIGLDTILLLEGEISDQVVEKNQVLINNLDQNKDIYGSIKSARLFFLIEFTKSQKKNKNIIKEINSTLSKLNKNGGYVSNIELDTPNIMSTYEAYRVKDSQIGLSNEEKNYIKVFLKNNLIPDDLIGFKAKGTETSLRELYSGSLLAELLLN